MLFRTPRGSSIARASDQLRSPMAIYEMHLGSWRHVPEENDRPLTYRELAPRLADYINDLGFTHVELMPIMEHPFLARGAIKSPVTILRALDGAVRTIFVFSLTISISAESA